MNTEIKNYLSDTSIDEKKRNNIANKLDSGELTEEDVLPVLREAFGNKYSGEEPSLGETYNKNQSDIFEKGQDINAAGVNMIDRGDTLKGLATMFGGGVVSGLSPVSGAVQTATEPFVKPITEGVANLFDNLQNSETFGNIVNSLPKSFLQGVYNKGKKVEQGIKKSNQYYQESPALQGAVGAASAIGDLAGVSEGARLAGAAGKGVAKGIASTGKGVKKLLPKYDSSVAVGRSVGLTNKGLEAVGKINNIRGDYNKTGSNVTGKFLIKNGYLDNDDVVLEKKINKNKNRLVDGLRNTLESHNDKTIPVTKTMINAKEIFDDILKTPKGKTDIQSETLDEIRHLRDRIKTGRLTPLEEYNVKGVFDKNFYKQNSLGEIIRNSSLVQDSLKKEVIADLEKLIPNIKEVNKDIQMHHLLSDALYDKRLLSDAEMGKGVKLEEGKALAVSPKYALYEAGQAIGKSNTVRRGIARRLSKGKVNRTKVQNNKDFKGFGGEPYNGLNIKTPKNYKPTETPKETTIPKKLKKSEKVSKPLQPFSKFAKAKQAGLSKNKSQAQKQINKLEKEIKTAKSKGLKDIVKELTAKLKVFVDGFVEGFKEKPKMLMGDITGGLATRVGQGIEGGIKAVKKNPKTVTVYQGRKGLGTEKKFPLNYFAETEDVAKSYGPNVIKKTIKLENLADFTKPNDNLKNILITAFQKNFKKEGLGEFYVNKALKQKTFGDTPLFEIIEDPKVTKALQNAGYDSVKYGDFGGKNLNFKKHNTIALLGKGIEKVQVSNKPLKKTK